MGNQTLHLMQYGLFFFYCESMTHNGILCIITPKLFSLKQSFNFSHNLWIRNSRKTQYDNFYLGSLKQLPLNVRWSILRLTSWLGWTYKMVQLIGLQSILAIGWVLSGDCWPEHLHITSIPQHSQYSQASHFILGFPQNLRIRWILPGLFLPSLRSHVALLLHSIGQSSHKSP